MLKKSIDSILKRANKIVRDLQSVVDDCDVSIDVNSVEIENLEAQQNQLLSTRARATSLAAKWSDLV